MNSPVEISRVTGRRETSRFRDLPNMVNAGDPQWIPPLRMERSQHISPRHNPYFKHADTAFWLALRDGLPVGRISAQVDSLHQERYGDDTGFFGMLDAEDDPEVFKALLATAEQWLQARGMRRILGPFNFSINEECGLLVEGFDTPPMVMMGHAQPYADARIRAQGYDKAMDTLAYHLDAERYAIPVGTRRLMERISQESGVTVRPMVRDRLKEELETVRDIFNDAWSANWGFVPFTRDEFDTLGEALKFLVHDDMIQIAEVNGEPAAMMVSLPNINEAVRDLNGRLLPFGWAKLLWRLKVGYPRSARVALMGVRRRYHDTPLGPALALMVVDASRNALMARGVKSVEMSWILETNSAMRRIIESLGGEAYKRYRIYEKALRGK